ncbi:4'-phosphopantetheinyl transferase superfamily protein [Paraglaciecola sp.]|uniref:4'-phosphopantetheinyl transferase family protein n=1 Tax=Paraglaciecola sp. TaxID=1920173 RepID=UPI0030F47392
MLEKVVISKFFTQQLIISMQGQDNIVGFRCNFDLVNFNAQLLRHHKIYFPITLQSSVIKRQAEFFAGRYAAKQILDTLGYQDFVVAIGENRGPVWPDTLVGSITHHGNVAICALGKKKDIRALGIDIEPIIKPETQKDIGTIILNEREKLLIKSTTLSYGRAFTISFSAKESLFKALHPFVHRYFGFEAAEIISLCPQKNTFALRLCENLSEEFVKGFVISGFFQETELEVFTQISF